SGEGDDDRPGGGPTRPRHQCTTTSSRSFSNVAAPTSLRDLRSPTVRNGCCSRDAMILAAVTGPIPGRVSSCAAVAVLRSIGPFAPPDPLPPAPPPASPPVA